MLEEARTRRLNEINSGLSNLLMSGETRDNQAAANLIARQREAGKFGMHNVHSSASGFVCSGRINGDEHVSRSSIESNNLGRREV